MAETTLPTPAPARSFWRGQAVKHALPTLLLVVALAVAAYAIQHELENISFSDVVGGLSALPTRAILASLAFTALSYITLIGYDASAFRYLGIRTPAWRLIIGSFCGYAIANTAGFALLTGATARYRIHASGGLTLLDAGRIALFSAFAFTVGVTLIGAIGLLVAPEAIAGLVRLPVWAVRAIALLLLGAVFGLLVVSARGGTVRLGRFSFTPPTFRLVMAQLVLSVLELLASGAALYLLLPTTSSITFTEFLPVYCAALAAGILSHVPGGVGVFDAVILAAFSWRTEPGGVVAALLAYRFIYFLLPFVLAILTLAMTEISRSGAKATRRLGKYSDIAEALAPVAGAAVAIGAAVLLLLSGAVPALTNRLSSVAAYIPVTLIEAAHFLSSVVAGVLMFLTLGLMRRLNAAFWLTITLLVIASALALLKGFALVECGIYLGMALVLLPFRDAFERSTAFVDQPLTPTWIAAFTLLLAAAGYVTLFAFETAEFGRARWFEFALENEAPRSARALLGASITALVIAGFILLRRPAGAKPTGPTPEELERAARIVATQDRAEASLVFQHDKGLVFSGSGRAFVMFGAQGRSWITLGDPVGAEQERRELVWQFREAAARARARPVFYLATADMAPAYVDAGFYLLKIAEEARVRLGTFSLEGRPRASLRAALAQADREDLSFAMLNPREALALMPVLADISGEWLATRNQRETGFLLGRFEPSTLARFDVAVMRRGGKPIAFATVLRTKSRAEASIDLLRHVADASPVTMAALVTRTMLAYRDQGFREFGLGVSPVLELEPDQSLPRMRRFGTAAHAHGERFFRTRGSRTFKDGFGPVWAPRYLASLGGLDPIDALNDAADLIAGSARPVDVADAA